MSNSKAYTTPFRVVFLAMFLLHPWMLWGQNSDSVQLVVPQKVYCDTGFISPNGKFLYTFKKGLFSNHPIAVWDVKTGSQISADDDHFWFVKRAFQDNYLACLAGQKVRIWNTQLGSPPIEFSPPNYVNGIEVDPTGQYVCARTYSSPGFVYRSFVYRLKDGKFLYSVAGANYSGASAKGHLVALQDSVVNLHQWSDGELIKTYLGADQTAIIKEIEQNLGEQLPAGKDYLAKHDQVLSYTYKNGSTRIDLKTTSGKLIQSFTGYSLGFKVGVINRDGSTLVSTHANSVKIWDFKTGTYLRGLNDNGEREYFPTFLSDISPNGTYIVLEGKKVYNSLSGSFLYEIEQKVAKNNTEISNNNKWLVAGGMDSNAYVYNPKDGKLLQTIRINERISDCIFSSNSKLLAICAESITIVWNLEEARVVSEFPFGEAWSYGTFLAFSPDNKRLVVASRLSGKRRKTIVKICDVETGSVVSEFQHNCNGVLYSPDGKYLLLSMRESNGKGSFDIYNAGTLIHHSNSWSNLDISPTNAIVFSADSKYLRAFSGKSAFIWDVENGIIKHRLASHKGQVGLAVFSTDGHFVLTTGNDHNMRLWETETGEEMLQLYAFDDGDYLHMHPSGLFDGSPGALEKVFFRQGTEIIDLAQLKNRYYEPGLWEKVINKEPLRDVRGMNKLSLQPKIELLEIEKGILPINLTKRSGGYGKVSVFINGKEIEGDARGNSFDTSLASQTLNINIANHPFLKSGDTNTIEVKTWSADGFVESRGAKSVYVDSRTKKKIEPSFFGIVCGVSEYYNGQLDLKYSVNDAETMAATLRKGASNLFGTKNTYVYSLTSPGELLPTKENIQQVFQEIQLKAKPEDVVLIYLSGHGVVWGGDAADFYFLTSDATSLQIESYSDPELRKRQSISTAEFTSWINELPALKQVMIIDACGSGKAVDNLIASRSVDPSQVRAIDRMKDRTGMYVISGCTADAVSYEASRYGQGLLTYALLQGMKGAALKENKRIDIEALMQHAREVVPKMAYGIGGIQSPQILSPKGGSFDIGILNDDDKSQIPLAKAKPVFIRSLFIDRRAKRDKLSITRAMNDKLMQESDKGIESKFLYFDSDEYADSYSLSGDYFVEDSIIYLEVVIAKGEVEITRLQTSSTSIEKAVEAIYLELSTIKLD